MTRYVCSRCGGPMVCLDDVYLCPRGCPSLNPNAKGAAMKEADFVSANSDGSPGARGVADVLDEARAGRYPDDAGFVCVDCGTVHGAGGAPFPLLGFRCRCCGNWQNTGHGRAVLGRSPPEA